MQSRFKSREVHKNGYTFTRNFGTNQPFEGTVVWRMDDQRKSFENPFDEEKSIGLTTSSTSSVSDTTVSLSIPEKSWQGCSTRGGISGPFDSRCAADSDLGPGLPTTQGLPQKKGSRFYRNARWILLTPFRRLWLISILLNILAFFLLVSVAPWRKEHFTHLNTSTATSVNILIAVVIRQEFVVNLLFATTCLVPRSTPLWFRRRIAKVYTYGGLHSGCALAATGWYFAFTGLAYHHVYTEPSIDAAVAVVATISTILLSLICISSHPAIRTRCHNHFEAIHRFGGWAAVALFWVQTMLILRDESHRRGTSLRENAIWCPSFWCILIVTCSIALPWLRIRPMKVRPEPLSQHAIRLHFDDARSKFGQGFRLSDRPLLENHAFAAIPKLNEARGFSVIVSRAGDWTSRIIQSPPTRLWTHGTLQYGAIRVGTLFEPLLVVATGSGIAPCLSLFHGAPDLRCRVLWSASDPLTTYGTSILESVMRKDNDAIIIDTQKSGRPDLVREAYALYRASKAEAVMVISNAHVTRKVVYGLEARGVPVFAPVFDS